MSNAEALAHLRAGRPQAALALLESRLQLQPADAQGWFLLGACRHALNDLPAAAGAFSRSLSLDPANPEAHLAYISILRATGDARGALAASQQAQARCPGEKRLLYAAALCLEDLGQPDDALSHYDTAIALDPGFEDALHNRGLLLSRLGRFEEARANQLLYVAARPDSARAHSGLADMLAALGMFGDALKALTAAQRLAPDDVSVQVRKGVAFASLRRFDETTQAFSAARAQDPKAVAAYLQRIAPGSDPALMLSPQNLYFWQGHRALQRCDWALWQELVEQLRRLPSLPGAAVEPAVAFIAFHLPLTGAERHAIARHVATAIESRAPVLPAPPARPAGRIKLGVLSPDLREHLNAYLLLPLFEMLDRERFALHAYALAPDDGSEIRSRLAASADRFRDLQAATDEEAARLVRTDGIDILLDVGGHTTGGRFGITARRPARVQAAYLGFAGSLGSKRVDYVITDAVAGGDPGEWSEAPVFLPSTYYLYDFRQAAPQTAVVRRDYGLPDDAFVYCAFHKAEKISPDAFALWMDILKQVPRSVLWFLAVPDAAQRNLRRAAGGHGVDAKRLVFAPFEPRKRYLERQCLGDLMLDTLHHSAMTTACDALAAALPVLTLRGSAMASRAGESLLRAAGVPELVAGDTDAYVAMAVGLASDRGRLNQFRRTLASRTGPLFDTAARVREIEAALTQMWHQYAQRL